MISPTSKQCRRCLSVLPSSEFYRHSQMGDGTLNVCKSCVKARVARHRLANLERVRHYDRMRGRTPERIDKCRDYMKRHPEVKRRAADAWDERNRHKKKAHYIVGNAIRDGKLSKQPCEVCGDPKVEGHHDDYSKPLDVRWLCDKHHKEHHNQVRESIRLNQIIEERENGRVA